MSRVCLSIGKVSTLAGGTEGFRDGVGTQAQFFHPTGLTFDHRTKVIYVTDQVILYATHNGPFPNSHKSLFQNEAKCEDFDRKTSFIFPGSYSRGLFSLVGKETSACREKLIFLKEDFTLGLGLKVRVFETWKSQAFF